MAELQQIPFRAGLDEGTDPKQLPAGTLKVAKNVRQDKSGRVVKRHGTELLTNSTVAGGTVTASGRLFEAAKGGLGMTDGTYAYTWAPDVSKWSAVDTVAAFSVTRKPLVSSSQSVAAASCAVYGSMLVSVWSLPDSTYGGGTTDVPVFFQVTSIDTDEVLVPPTKLTSVGHNPRVVIFGTKAVFLWNSSFSTLRYCDLTMTTLSLGTAADLDTGTATGGGFDACVSGSYLYVVYKLAAGSDRTRVQAFTSSYVTVTGTTDFGGTGYTGYAISATVGEYVYVAASDGSGNVVLATLTPNTLFLVGAPSIVYAAAGSMLAGVAFVERASATTCLVGVNEIDASNGLNPRRATTFIATNTTHAITANTTRRTNHALWSTHAWSMGGKWYAAANAIVGSSDISPMSTLVLEIGTSAYTSAVAPHLHIATLENQTAGMPISNTTTNGAVTLDADGFAYVPSMFRREERTVGSYAPVGVNVNRVATGGDALRMLKNGNVDLFVSGAPSMFDGHTVQPYGFPYGPQIGTIAYAGSGGSIAAGTYQYCCVFVRSSPNGVTQRSMPGPVHAGTAGASDIAVIPITSASPGGKLTEGTGFSLSACNVRVDTYRSTIGGSILHKLTFEPTHNIVDNFSTTSLLSLSDANADADITNGGTATTTLASRPQIYTASELDDVPPPAATTGAVHKNRFWLIASDEFTLWASKDASEDLEIAPGFNEELTLGFAVRKKALASLDEKLVVFGASDIDIVFGDGPQADGEGGSWQVSRVHTDIGCGSPRSVVVAPPGIPFLSSRGFELLDRGLTVSYIGAPVEDTLASYPVVTSAVLVPDDEEVRWTCNNSGATSGVVIAWNYRINAWYTRTYWSADGLTLGAPITDAAIVNGVYTMLLASGRVIQETTEHSKDVRSSDVYVPLEVQAPVYPTGPVGWHRLKDVQIVGQSLSNHKLTIEVSRDFSASFEQTKTWAEGTDVTTVGPLEQARMTLKHQKRQAAVVRIYDAAPTDILYSIGTGQGPALELLSLYVLPKTGPAKISASRRA